MYDLINLIVNDRQKGLCIMIHHVLVSILKRILSATHLSFLWRFSCSFFCKNCACVTIVMQPVM